MKSVKATTFRPGKVSLGIVVGFLIMMSVYTVFVWYRDPIMLWLNGGQWCM